MPAPRSLVSLACAAVLAASPAFGAPATGRPASSTPIPLQSNPGTQTDSTARRLAADDLEAARARGDRPLVLTGRALLGGPTPALLVQLQSAQECGSAGCTTSVYSMERGHWIRVLDSATGRLTVSAAKTRGRNDLLSEDDHFVWTGRDYVSLDPAPSLNLRPPAHPNARPSRRG